MNHVLTDGHQEILPDEAELHPREDEAGLRLALGLEPMLHYGPIAETLPRLGHAVWWGRFVRRDRVEFGLYCVEGARLRVRILDEEGGMLVESHASQPASLTASVPRTGLVLFHLTNLRCDGEVLRFRVARHRTMPNLIEPPVVSAPLVERSVELPRLVPGPPRRGRA